MRKLRSIDSEAMVSVIITIDAHAREFQLGGAYNGSNMRQAGKEEWTERAGLRMIAPATDPGSTTA